MRTTGGYVIAHARVGMAPKGMLDRIADRIPGRVDVLSRVTLDAANPQHCWMDLSVRYPATGDVWGAWPDDIAEALNDAIKAAGTSNARVEIVSHTRYVTKRRQEAA